MTQNNGMPNLPSITLVDLGITGSQDSMRIKRPSLINLFPTFLIVGTIAVPMTKQVGTPNLPKLVWSFWEAVTRIDGNQAREFSIGVGEIQGIEMHRQKLEKKTGTPESHVSNVKRHRPKASLVKAGDQTSVTQMR